MRDKAKKILFAILSTALCMSFSLHTIHHTQAAIDRIEITGYVFLDENDNALRDDGEPGIPGVVVSDQVAVVATDQNGAYQIVGSGGLGVVFISTPNTYTARVPFWKHIDRKSGRCQADFPLKQNQKTDSFSFIHASDPHLNEATLPRLNKFKAIAESLSPDFILMTGDLVFDAIRVNEEEARGCYELYKREIEGLSIPFWNVPGNHEIFGIERHHSLVSSSHPLYGMKMYRHYLGPDYYSFNFGGIHFVGLNTVDYHDIWYYGNIPKIQLAWLEQDLSFVPPGVPVVTFNHIPFYSAFQSILGYMDSARSSMLIEIKEKTYFRHTVNNASDALNLLKKHNYCLALAGHLHATENLSYEMGGLRIRFNQSSAILGDVSYEGMKMISGVTLYRVKDGIIDDGKFIPLDKTTEE